MHEHIEHMHMRIHAHACDCHLYHMKDKHMHNMHMHMHTRPSSSTAPVHLRPHHTPHVTRHTPHATRHTPHAICLAAAGWPAPLRDQLGLPRRSDSRGAATRARGDRRLLTLTLTPHHATFTLTLALALAPALVRTLTLTLTLTRRSTPSSTRVAPCSVSTGSAPRTTAAAP